MSIKKFKALLLTPLLLISTAVMPDNTTWKPIVAEFDWVQLTSGEWLKGEIKSMYNESVEFDSDKLNLLRIDLQDVKYF